MNNVVDEVLAGSPRYNIKDNGGSAIYSNVQIDLATAVTTQGTPLNKALFDSIQSDLTNLSNNKLNVSDKATTAQAQAGSNDTKYMTPSKVKEREQSLFTTKSITGSTASEQTLFDFSTATGSIVEISGRYKNTNNPSNYASMTLNGTVINGSSAANLSMTDYSFQNVTSSTGSFYFRFDLTTKTFTGKFSQRYNGSQDYVVGYFTTLTSLTGRCRGGATTTIDISINQNY